jgi:hypothetical protein
MPMFAAAASFASADDYKIQTPEFDSGTPHNQHARGRRSVSGGRISVAGAGFFNLLESPKRHGKHSLISLNVCALLRV